MVEGLVLYGSQTGTAEDVAYKIYAVLRDLFNNAIREPHLLPSASMTGMDSSNDQAHVRHDTNVSAEQKHIEIDSFNQENVDDRISMRIESADQVDISSLPSYSILIAVISTTGDGDMPDSMNRLWKFLLRRNLASDSLSSTTFAVFGLGDSSYAKYNAAARKVYNRIQQLGARELIGLGLGDDQAKYGYLTALDPWISQLREGLMRSFKIKEPEILIAKPVANVDVYSISRSFPKNPMEITNELRDFLKPPSFQRNGHLSGCESGIFKATLVNNHRMTSDDWFQDIRHLEFEIPVIHDSSNETLYEPSDIVVVYPRNPSQFVDRAISIMAFPHGYRSDDSITTSQVSPHSRPSRITATDKPLKISDLFTAILDICGTPQRSYFEGLAPYATSDEEKEKLLEISSAEGMDIYYKYIIREKRNYVEVLEDFRSCRPPLHKLLELIPVIQPRQYSIASYARLLPSRSRRIWGMDLCVGRTQTKTSRGRIKNGVCSNFLCDLKAGDSIYLSLRPGKMKFPSIQTPLILVGPGTGVAPMRSIISHRLSSQQSGATESTGQTVLFYGCRSRLADYLYREEWERIATISKDSKDSYLLQLSRGLHSHPIDATKQPNLQISVAFSRETIPISTESSSIKISESMNSESLALDGKMDVSSQKNYVTHKIRLHGNHVWDLIHNQGAYIFVSGSANRMPKDVRAAFVEVAMKHGGLSELDSEQYVSRLERSKRYIVEAWS